MTDTDFNDLDLQKDISEMDEEEAKKTLSEFMEAHKQNKAAYDATVEELEETAAEYSQKVEELEERMAEFREKRAAEASEYVNMPADLIADRFSYDEIEQIIEEAEESEDFSEEDESDEDEDDDRLTTFSERDEKGRFDDTGAGSGKNRERAKERMKRKGFPVSE